MNGKCKMEKGRGIMNGKWSAPAEEDGNGRMDNLES
jgi:hypothetical protein